MKNHDNIVYYFKIRICMQMILIIERMELHSFINGVDYKLIQSEINIFWHD